MSRFDYVKYGETAQSVSQAIKEKFEELEKDIDALVNGRSKAMALTKLEESFMWVGKTLRDQQLLANEVAAKAGLPKP